MGRTAVNVSGAMTSGLLTSKVQKQLDTDVYNDSENQVEVSA
jgi:L-cystine uptake protein TcyP (sodium:dicarboxylate symporter family)